jgi:hypothetical protein
MWPERHAQAGVDRRSRDDAVARPWMSAGWVIGATVRLERSGDKVRFDAKREDHFLA